MNQRISFFFPSMVDGGAERVTLNLIQYLAKHYSYRLDLVLVSATGAFMEQVPDEVNVVDLKASRTLKSLPALVRYLKKTKPDALLSGMDFVNVIALSAVKISRVNVRTVACLHINMSSQLNNPYVFRGRFIKPFIKLTHPWADVIVGTSRGCGEDFIKVTGVGQDNMRYIYNPAITDTIAPLAAEAIDHPWFGSEQPPVIVAVGRLVHQKNFPLLIDAFASLRKANKVRLMIFGDGDDRSELEAQIARLGLESDIALPGFVPNPYMYMKNAKMFVLSSRYEALPAVLIEAMYCGTQLVAMDCPSGPREILLDGKYGELVPPEDKSGLVKAMENALQRDGFVQDPSACDRFIDHNVIDQYLDALLGDGTAEAAPRKNSQAPKG